MTSYYLDTCIWLDLYEKRGINGEIAVNLIKKILEESGIIICSDLHLIELRKLNYTKEEIKQIFNSIKPCGLCRVHIDRNEIVEMNKRAQTKKIPRKDILHAILARDNDALMISRDYHFDLIKNIIQTKRPEDI